RGLFGSSPTSSGSCVPPVKPGPLGPVPAGPEPGTTDDRNASCPSANSFAKPPVKGSSYTGNTQSVYWLNSQYEWQSLCCRQLYAPIESMIGTTFDCTSGKWSLALGRRGGVASRVKTWVGTLVPPPVGARARAAAWVIMADRRVPSARRGAAARHTH